MNPRLLIQKTYLILFVLLVGVACSNSGVLPDEPLATVIVNTATPIPPTATAIPTHTAIPPPPTAAPDVLPTVTSAPLTATPTITPVPATPTAVPSTEAGIHEQALTLADGSVLEYVISIPPSYSGEEAVPLVVSLAGGVPHINPNWVIAPLEDITLMSESLSELGAIIITPHPVDLFYARPEGMAAVLAVMDHVIDQYNVDLNRTLITGRGRGATGAWYIAARNQDRFTAAIMNTGSPASKMDTYEWTIPIFIIASSNPNHQFFPFTEIEPLFQQLTEMGYEVELAASDETVDTYLQTEGLLNAIPWLLDVWNRSE